MIKNIKTKNIIVFSGMIFILSILSGNLYSFYSFNGINNEIKEENETLGVPLMSAGEANLITPENTTYTAPTSGFYPGTYSFQNDANGAMPSGWTGAPGTGCSMYVEALIAGHSKVVRLHDNGPGDADIKNGFSGQVSGSIDFWYCVAGTLTGNLITIYDGSVSHSIYLDIGPGNYLRYFDGTYHNIVQLSSSQWYHIKIEWNTASNWNIWVNTAKYSGSGFGFRGSPAAMDYIMFWTDLASTGVDTWVDGIGYSWDPNYNIGDNKYEGLELTYDSTTTLDRVGFSLDGQANKTITDNTTIPMPSEGSHTIELFGNSSGTTYTSGPRNFHVYPGASEPDAPGNFQVIQGWIHNFLTWDVPDNNNAPILNYNVYRGEDPGGSKILIGSPTDPEFNDTTAVVDTMYYYVVSAENIIGESPNSTEDSGMARNAPFVEWESPCEGDEIIFPVGNYVIFNFTYENVTIDDIRLFLNNTDMGSVWGKTFINTTYGPTIEGLINATLVGYLIGAPICQDSLNLTFSKLTLDVSSLMQSNTEYIGKQLYLILHDPSGDKSYSSVTESSKLSFGVDAALTVGGSVSYGFETDFNLFGVSGEYSQKIEYKASAEFGHSFRYEVTDTTGITSNQDENNKEFIGPGLGDRYWGEAWTIKWELHSSYRVYYNGTARYEDPVLKYGIIRSAEVVLNDVEAPVEWTDQNPVHTNWTGVSWISSNFGVAGGAPQTLTHEVETSSQSSSNIIVGVSGEHNVELGLTYATTWSVEVKKSVYTQSTHTSQTFYQIWDDESTDYIVQDIGIDDTFGTYIFRPNEFFSETSYPLEYNTSDYLPPIIDFPDIDLDSTNDGISPCNDDKPTILVEIFDEGGVQTAYINYSVNGGANWDTSALSELVFNPGTWSGYIPERQHGTTVLWHVRVFDNSGRNDTRKDQFGNDYSYTVINRAPTVSLISPNGGTTYKDTLTVQWSGVDLDTDDLTYSLAYSKDGEGWRLIAEGLTGYSYEWDISGVVSSDAVYIKVIANDGYGGVSADSSDYLFTIDGIVAATELDIPFFEIASMASIGIAVAAIVVVMKKRTEL